MLVHCLQERPNKAFKSVKNLICGTQGTFSQCRAQLINPSYVPGWIVSRF